MTLPGKGGVKHQLGQSERALGIFREGLKVLERWNAEGDRATNVGELHLNLSLLLYEWNRLEEVDIHLQQASDFNQRSQFPPVLALEYEIAFHLHLAHRRTEAAVGMLGKLDALLSEAHPDNRLYAQLFGVTAQRMRLHLAPSVPGFSHLLDDVQAWVEARRLKPGDAFDYPVEGNYDVLARLLLAQGRAAESLSLLVRLTQAARASERVRDLVRYLSLQALAEHKLGREAASQAALQRALALTEPEGYCRSFVDHGAPMRTLLEWAARQTPTPYTTRLLAAFPNMGDESLAASYPNPVATHPAVARNEDWLEPLNDRERSVLRLLAVGNSYKQIAKELRLSPNTVRWYMQSLYAKLQVGNRTEAVNRARDAGLL
jgi:LuxR family maltose regulon positive regulatory protein